MSPRLVATVVALLLISPSVSAQTVPAPAAGEPPQVAPRPLAIPAADPAMLQNIESLRQLLAQRDQIQRQIDQLIVETQTPQQMIVHLELLEINITAAEKLANDFREPRLSAVPPGGNVWAVAEIELLREKGIAKSLAKPRLMTASGQSATSRVGNEEAASSLEVQLRPDSLGNNQVHLELFVERSTSSSDSQSNRNQAIVPQKFSMTTSLDLVFGETRILSGMLIKRTQTRRSALGRVTEEITTEPVLLVRVEGIAPRHAGVVPAAAIAPR